MNISESSGSKVILLVRIRGMWLFKRKNNSSVELISSEFSYKADNARDIANRLWCNYLKKPTKYLQYLLPESDINQKIVFSYFFDSQSVELLCEAQSNNELYVQEGGGGEFLSENHRFLFEKLRENRRVINSYFRFDNRKTIGRISRIFNGDNYFDLKQGIADPIDIAQTIWNIFKNNSNNFSGPIQLDINPTTKCSDKCTFCFNVNDRLSFPGTLELDKTIELVNYLCSTTSLMHIKISGFGDPLIYPDLWELIEFCRSKCLYVTINSNGFGLNKVVPNILKYLDSIRFSIDAGTSATFKAIHGQLNFDKRLKHIEELVQSRKNMVDSELIIGIHYVLIPENMKEVRMLAEWSKELGIDYFEVTMDKFDSAYLNKWNKEQSDEAISHVNGLLSLIDEGFNVILPPSFTMSKVSLEKFRNSRFDGSKCWHMEFRHYVTPHHEIGSCNSFVQFLPRKKVFGNIQQSSPIEIYSANPISRFSKTNDCYNCVIPFGILNDLTEWIKEAIQNNNELVYDTSAPAKLI